MRTLGIIPARGGSRRLPGKNLLPLGGRPLIQWVLDAALAAKRLNRVVVSSDSPEILELARQRDPRLPLERPAELATDTSLAIEYVHHALKVLERENGEAPYEAIAILQPTSPLTRPEDIDATVQLLEQSDADAAVTAVELDHALHPSKLKTLEGDRLLPYLEEEGERTAAHQLPKLYVRNCAVYVSRRKTVEEGKILGLDCRGHLMPRERSVDINDGLDFRFAEFLLQQSEERS